MNLCTYVSEEGGDVEDVVTEASSLQSYTLRYVSLGDIGRLCQEGVDGDSPSVFLIPHPPRRGGCGIRNTISEVIHT
jgi:hypothetical protein